MKTPITILVFALYLFFRISIYYESKRISHAPSWAKIEKIVYSAEDSTGIGLPGDDEAGIIIYEIPSDIAKEIGERGNEYLNKMSSVILTQKNSAYGDRNFQVWKETPIADEDWTSYTGCECFRDEELKSYSRTRKPHIFYYLNKDMYFAEVEKDVENEINKYISEKGSYYSKGRFGTFIFIPSRKRAVFVY